MKPLGGNCTLYMLGPQKDLPEGDTWQCSACYARIRTGYVHTANEPWPHSCIATLIVREETIH